MRILGWGREVVSKKYMICLQTSDEQEIDMALRYWALDANGKWAESVGAIAQFYGISKHELPMRVQTVASAHDLESRCFWCETPEPLTSRTSLTSTYSRNSGFRRYQKPSGAQLCPSCEAINQQRHQEAVQAEQRERRDKINQALAQVTLRQVRLSLDELSVIDAAYFLSLLLAAQPEVDQDESEFFILSSVLSGSERVDGEICQRLFTIGAITPSAKGGLGAFEIRDDGKISFAWPNVPWELGPGIKDIPYLNLCDQLSTLLDGSKATSDGIEKMWLDVASAECETVLLDQINHYYLGDYVVGDKTLQAFHYALERFSIPRVWGIIYSVTKNAASLKQSREFTIPHIRNMLPGMIIRFVDRALDQKWNVYARTRKEYHVESMLTSVFFGRVLRQSLDGFHSATTNSIRQGINSAGPDHKP